MESYCGQTGVVLNIDSDGDCRVKFSDGNTWSLSLSLSLARARSRSLFLFLSLSLPGSDRPPAAAGPTTPWHWWVAEAAMRSDRQLATASAFGEGRPLMGCRSARHTSYAETIMTRTHTD